MVAGTVNSRLEAIIRLAVQGLNGKTRQVKAVVDTGSASMKNESTWARCCGLSSSEAAASESGDPIRKSPAAMRMVSTLGVLGRCGGTGAGFLRG